MAKSSLQPVSILIPQVAALPVRFDADGTVEILMITSRGTGRWIIPKGWPMRGRKMHEAAAREAMEEAGITGKIGKKPIGRYTYEKQFKDGSDQCEVIVYALKFERQLLAWREKGQRRVGWFSIPEAAARVQETGLREIILSLRPTRQEPAMA
jgi:8-oxo-dGTP pyrophosphatase MutT (NUDIX family)